MIPALLIGIISILISLIGAVSNPTRFFHSYLFSFMFWLDLPLGSLTLLMIYQLTGGTWGAASRRIFEASAQTISMMAVLFLPILFGMHSIYPWLSTPMALDPKIIHKASYLNSTGFIIRAIFYFACWIVLTHFLKKWSNGIEEGQPIETRAKARSLSAGGLVLYVLTATFAAFDWQMSLEPKWYSTIYGMVFCTAQGLSAFAFGLIIFVWLTRRSEYAGLFPNKTKRDLGRLLLAMVMVWAYLSFMQFLVIWMGNLPEEAIWFIHRTHGGWQAIAIALIVLQFGLPFCALLFRGTKDHLPILRAVACLTFVIRIADHYWTIMPGLYPQHIELHWQDATTLIGVGGLWFAAFLHHLRKQPIFATKDIDWPIEPNIEVRPRAYSHD
ncbi:MAG: hypothetical protein ACJ763_19950 [Bdellovibrionia bacterium]